MNIKEYLQRFLSETELEESSLQLPDVQLDPGLIQCIMISEVPPADEMEGFYSQRMDADYVKSSLALFQDADVQAQGVQDLLDMGIYITTAVKAPKHQYAVPTDEIARHVPLLEKELDLFPNLKVIMLMGDVAKKAFNMITKKRIRKNVIPSASTCKIREGAFYYGSVRVFPSYIMTGGNILIEKSKRIMISDDIKRMVKILKDPADQQ